MKKIKILGVIAFTLFFAGCNEFLDEVPDNRTELDTPDKISQLLTSAYPKSTFATVANAMGDGVQAFIDGGISITNDHAFHWRDSQETNQDSPDYFWTACYTAIASANHALEAIAAVENPTEQQTYQRSEALLCRAFAHFLIVNLFAKTYVPGEANDAPGIPYVDQPETVVMAQYSRNTVAYVYQRIEQDIEEGLKTIAPESNFKVPAYHFTEKAALAFASRFYLYKGDYSRVIQLTNRLIPEPTLKIANGNISGEDLANVWAATYFAPFKSTAWGSDPAIIEPAFRSATAKHNFLLVEGASYVTSSRSYRYAFANDAYMPGSNKINIAGGYWPWSVRGWQAIGAWYYVKLSAYFYYTTATTGYNMVMFPFFRAEEVLLNRIEAKIHLNMLDGAINDLNVYYRQRTGSSTSPSSAYNETGYVLNQAKITGYWRTQLDNPDLYLNLNNPMGVSSWSRDRQALLITLLDTRRCEFLMEGMRWFDILRYKIPVTHIDIDGSMATLGPDDLRRVWQLPEAAELAGMELNPR